MQYYCNYQLAHSNRNALRKPYIYRHNQVIKPMALQHPSAFYDKLNRSLISIVLIFLILFWAQHILIPVAFATLFALLLVTLCNFFERLGISRGLSALFSTLLFILAGTVVLFFISTQIAAFKNDLPKLTNLLLAGLDQFQAWIVRKFNVSTYSIDEFIHSATTKALSNSTSIIETTVGTVSGALIYLVLIPIYTMLLLYYRGLIVRFFVTVFHPKHTGVVMGVLLKVRYVIKVYILGLFIEMAIVAVMNCTGFLLLGVKYAFLLGVIAALLNVIPYLGIFTACAISLLVTSTTNTPGTVAGVGLVLLVVHLIDANIILPKVVGSKVKINVLVTLLSVLVGSALWGIAGMFLFIPIAAVLKIIFDSVEELKPWGLLLGEEASSVAPKPARKWKNLFSSKNKKRSPAVK